MKISSRTGMLIHNDPNQQIQSVGIPQNVDSEFAEATIITEYPEKRTEASKTFLMSDGTFLIASYQQPIHYKDNTGMWQNIDNSLRMGNPAETDLPQRFTNKAGPVSIGLEKESRAQSCVSMTIGSHTICWGLDGVGQAPLELITEEEPDLQNPNDSALWLRNLSQKIKYEEILPHIDVQYLITSSFVKEDIILKSSDAQKKFTETYQIGTLVPKQTEGQIIHLYEADNTNQQTPVYSIVAPSMTDSNGSTSNAVSLQIINHGSGQLQIEISAEEKWLNESERCYPVTIDPVIGWGIGVRDTFVSSGAPNNNFGYMGSLYIGNEVVTYKTCRILVDFDLPEMSKGDSIVQAQLNLVQFKDGMSPPSSSMIINTYEMGSAWNEHSDTWNNTLSAVQLSLNGPVLDYAVTSQSTNQKVVSWNLTKVVKGWYDGSRGHRGVLLTSNNESAAVRNQFYSSDYPSGTGLYPTLTLRYVNQTGLQEFWSYHNQSVGRAGMGHVHDYTGNLVFTIPITGTTGELAPLNFSLVFNSSMSGSQFKDGKRGGTFGLGFQSNLSQRIDSITEANATNDAEKEKFRLLSAAGYKFLYLDEDGTEHFFVTNPSNTSQYTDENGYDMILTTGGSSDEYFTLTYQDGSKKTFTQSGYLRKIYDIAGNALALAYSGANLSTATDGAGRVTTFGYTRYGTLDSITTPDGKRTQMRYDATNQQLTSITFFDGKRTQYSYINNLLVSATDIDGSRIEYTYELNGSDWMIRNRVTSAKEYSESGQIGNTVTMTYNIDNTTQFEYVSALGKRQREIYSFDWYGRPVSIINADSSATAYEYTVNPEYIAQKNKISAQAATIRPVVNLLKNHSAELTESSSSWTLYNQGTPAGQMIIATDTAFLGNKSLKVIQTQANSSKVSAQQEITGLQPGETYTFSAYVKTNLVTNGFANLFVQAFHGAQNPTEFIGKDGVNGTSSNWNRISLTFTVPANTTKITVNAGLINATGTAWFDCLQLESGNVANLYNLLENSSLQYASGGSSYIPTYWTGSELESGDGISNQKMHINGSPTKNKSLSQKIPINKLANKMAFVMSGKAIGDSVPTDAALGRYFALDLGIIFTDGTKQWTVVPFNADSSGEQYTTGPVYVLRDNLHKTIERVEFYIIYYKNANSAYFYDVQLNMDETGSTFSYNKNGQPVSSRQNAYNNEVFSYDNHKELIKAVNRNNETYEYFYRGTTGSAAHQLKSARSNQTKIGMYYLYDSKGNVIDSKMGTISASGAIDLTVPDNPYIQSTQGYSSNQNYMISASDQRGNITSYDIDPITGLIHSVTSPKGYETSYTYDPTNYFLTEASAPSSAGTVTIHYDYDTIDQLSKIIHNGFEYGFFYDDFGNILRIMVGTQSLINHTYATGNGNLLYSVYGNNFRIDYGYDAYNRIISVQKNNVLAYQYDYDARNNLARVTDTSEGTPKITNLFYDMADRLVRKAFGDDTEIRQEYDDMNRVISRYFRFASQTRLASYSYGVDNRKKESNLLSGAEMTFRYDTLNRIPTTDLIPTEGVDLALRTQLTYVNLTGNRTTTLVDTYSNRKKVGNSSTVLSKYKYTYDTNGNILTVTDSNSNVTTYTYDQLNQLVRVDDQKAANSIVYSYDIGGNITSARYFSYSTGSLGSAFLNVSYSYDDDNWRDLLTSYDGQFITYDAIGNPLTYRDDMRFTWAGRQLTTATVNGKTTSYIYNSDGIRTKKIVDGTATDYLVDGSTILAQRTGYNIMWFLYDSDGTRVGFTYNDDAYYYMKNVQGDVMGIVDSNLNIVVEYQYDAWGKLIETTGSEANFIGKLNPFLYRGYYYDTETGLYYLNSRYYDPQTGRFLNADFQIGANQDITSYNLFAYCGNSPVNRADLTGTFWTKIGNWLKNTANTVATWVSTTANSIKAWTDTNVLGAFASAASSQAIDTQIGNKVESVKIKKQVWRKTPLVNARNTHVKTTVTLPDTKALSFTKNVANKVGGLAIASYVADIYSNTQKYSGGNLAGAIAFDSVSLLASSYISYAIAGLTIGGVALPAAAVFIGALGIGFIISSLNEYTKETFLN